MSRDRMWPTDLARYRFRKNNKVLPEIKVIRSTEDRIDFSSELGRMFALSTKGVDGDGVMGHRVEIRIKSEDVDAGGYWDYLSLGYYLKDFTLEGVKSIISEMLSLPMEKDQLLLDQKRSPYKR